MPEDKTRPEPQRTTETFSEKGSVRGSAAVVGLAPSAQFVAPAMNLDPPAGGADSSTATADD